MPLAPQAPLRRWLMNMDRASPAVVITIEPRPTTRSIGQLRRGIVTILDVPRGARTLSPYLTIDRMASPSPRFVCSNCGSVDDVKSYTPGSILIELVLWIAFIIPGLVYSFWRLSARKEVCAACGSANLVPADTPAGRRLIALHADEADDEEAA
jgi:hypothetical protein